MKNLLSRQEKSAHPIDVSFPPSKEPDDKLYSGNLTYLIMTNENNHLNNHQSHIVN